MKIVFEVQADEPTEVEFNGETFTVFGHVQIIEFDDEEPVPAPEDLL